MPDATRICGLRKVRHMKGLYRVLPPLAPDYGGACEVMFELGGLVLIHDASGCTVNYVHFDEPRWTGQPSNVFCSGLSEIDAVMGDDSVLINKAIKAAELLKPNFIAFVGSSVPMVVGTDFDGIAMECEAACGIPCFGFSANGIRNYIEGASKALLAFVKRFCGRRTADRGVNLLGMLPMGFSSVEEAEKTRKMIASHSDGPVLSPGFAMSFEQLSELQNASKNLVVSEAGLETAEYMKKTYGIPYETGIPYDAEFLSEMIAAVRNKISVSTGNISSGSNEAGDRKDILIIGEGIEACSMAEVLQKELSASITRADVLDLFGKYEGARFHTAEESEIRQLSEGYDVIIADPCFAPLLGKDRIIARPLISVSGY